MSISNNPLHAAEAYIRSIRTGEHSAALALAPMLAADVEYEANGWMANLPVEQHKGYEAVLRRVTGNWANTAGIRHARWSAPRGEGSKVVIEASFDHIGGVAPASAVVTLSFNADGKINRIEHRNTPRQPKSTDVIPPGVKVLIDNALSNNTPLCVAYTDETGRPVLSMRGSIQTFSDTQLCAWIRHADGGLTTSIAKNPRMSFVYRDGTRALLILEGRGRVETGDDIRHRVFAMIPEVEQNHDPARRGAALIVDIDKIQGYATGGEPVRMARQVK
jgi:hypothetical protein